MTNTNWQNQVPMIFLMEVHTAIVIPCIVLTSSMVCKQILCYAALALQHIARIYGYACRSTTSHAKIKKAPKAPLIRRTFAKLQPFRPQKGSDDNEDPIASDSEATADPIAMSDIQQVDEADLEAAENAEELNQ
ncbi:uncharacterized protein LACBIDRAFT_321935 [Laccaria bicolor S238N-H82]|uniref:Predicted protein n=1 Tax=Laccaria bicolor (strain S238N-H82 / ATCC MYA-4686) TaxID=486041 RepID=B0CUP4_LACBS|nr:uncharacterized protein LACBIDRAFT_321935 [Laccaria bicolor S238N-H82]EDR14127.1 predicted protein [Laccaria bicolor S238N-H82]|eukprot:XP_001874686.1 predicted protein [Laccaria bicolor S238N-H82]